MKSRCAPVGWLICRWCCGTDREGFLKIGDHHTPKMAGCAFDESGGTNYEIIALD
jgi:hypothetical protein